MIVEWKAEINKNQEVAHFPENRDFRRTGKYIELMESAESHKMSRGLIQAGGGKYEDCDY